MANDGEVAVDRTMPAGPWKFDPEVTAVFDDMLERSIPQYDVMRRAIFDTGRAFVTPTTDVVDLGCSRGGALAEFVKRFGAHNRFVGVDVSEPMLAASRDRFKHYIESNVVDILNLDLRAEYPPVRASLTLAVFALQFIPIEYRQQVVQQMYDHTVEGGAAVIAEKVLGATARIDKALVANYYAMKHEHGYSQDAIERKRLSLEGVLVPVTAAWNVELLHQAGFRQVDCFWAWMNFRAFVAIK